MPTSDRKFTADPVIWNKIMTEERDRNVVRIQLVSARKEGETDKTCETARLMKQKGYSADEILSDR